MIELNKKNSNVNSLGEIANNCACGQYYCGHACGVDEGAYLQAQSDLFSGTRLRASDGVAPW